MSYSYEKEKPFLFTENGQRDFLKFRDKAKELLKYAGAFRLDKTPSGSSSWFQLACADRMVELGEILELKRDCWGQYRVFTETNKDTYP